MGKRPGARGGQETKGAAAPPVSKQTRQLPAAGAGGSEQPPWARGSRRNGAKSRLPPSVSRQAWLSQGPALLGAGETQGEATEGRGCPAAPLPHGCISWHGRCN